MEESKELKELLNKFKDVLVNHRRLISDEEKKDLIEKFSDFLSGNVSSCTFAVDGMTAFVGTRASLVSNILTLIVASIENGIFEDVNDICEHIKRAFEITRDIKD